MTNVTQISIIMASYNYARYITEAIESVLAQTYKNWELIIVDDGSQDNSVEIINEYCKKYANIKLYCHKRLKNKGLSKTIQLGIGKASGDWIAFLESDDALEPDYLEKKIEIINKEPKASFIFNDYRAIGNEAFGEESHHKIFQKTMKNRIGFFDYKNSFYRENPVPTFSVVMLKKNLLENLNFNTPIKPYLDRFLWGQIAKKTEFYYTEQPLTCWRKHPASYMNTKRPKADLIFYLVLGYYLPDIYKKKLRRLYIILKML